MKGVICQISSSKERFSRSHSLLNYTFYRPLSQVTLISHLQNRTFRSKLLECVKLMNDIVSLVQGNALSCNAKASQFSQGVITLFAASASITKPELFYWKLCLIIQETAVLTPYVVILITVTNFTGVCT